MTKEGCEDDEFECDEGACIKKTLLCDGRNDCSNGEDEYPYYCGGNGTYTTEDYNEVYPVSPEESATTTDDCK